MNETRMHCRTYSNLCLITLDKEGHDRTCDYWYLIQENHGPHTAFNRRDHLLRWLEDRNLNLTEDMPEHGKHSWQKVQGQYRECHHLGRGDFDAIESFTEVRQVDNARYTLAKITDEDGLRTVHLVNCNYDRPEFDYFESRAMVG